MSRFPFGPTILRIEWEREGFTAKETADLARSLSDRIADLKEVMCVNIRTYDTFKRVPDAPPSKRQEIAEKALGPWTVERAKDASEEIETLARELLDAEEEIAVVRRALNAYDRAELGVCLERNDLAERLRKQLAATINAEAHLVIAELGDPIEPGTDGWDSVIVVVCGCLAGAYTEFVAMTARLDVDVVERFASRLRSNGIWDRGKTLIDANIEDASELELWIWLASLVAEGDIVRVPEGYQAADSDDALAPIVG